MSRSVSGRGVGRQVVRLARVRPGRSGRRRPVPAAPRDGATAARLIGLPLAVSVPKIKGMRWRYCTRWDERPAAQLGKSLLRLGICRVEDWSGSAVDFVERGFKRFARENGSDTARKVWSGNLRITDQMFEMSELERNQAQAEREASCSLLYVVGDYEATASIPIGSALALLEQENRLLPAAFYTILVQNLWKWMRAYDYSDALDHAKMCMETMDEEELKGSFYLELEPQIPKCLRGRKMSHGRAVRLLQELQPTVRGSVVRQLVRHVLDMHSHGNGHEHAWPSRLARRIPDLEEFLSNADDCGPGGAIVWHDGDGISAAFDEQMQYLGQNEPMQPSTLLVINLENSARDLDHEVKKIFDYLGAMFQSLASAAKAVEIIRGIDDEHLRQHRLQSGLPAEPGAPGVRAEQL